MKILITGATGFIGKALSQALRNSGFDLRVAVRQRNIKLLIDYEVVQIDDIGPRTDWQEALAGVDTIIHLAARVHIMNESVADPAEAFRKVNMLGSEHLARMAVKAGVKRFIFLSSIKVNGEFTLKTDRDKFSYFSEDDLPNPQDHYGRSKWEAEQVLRKISEETKMQIVILRAPLVYGPGVKANFLNLMKLINSRLPLPFANIKNKRSLIFVGNLTDIIKNCIHNENIKGETYLVSDGQDISTPELMRLIAKAMKRKAMLFPFPIRILRILTMLIGKSKYIDRLTDSLRVRNDKIVKALNWSPLFSIEDGIEITIKHYLSKR